MEPDLRTLLREKAEEVRPDARIPGSVLRRSRRRRVITGLLAGTLTLGAVAGLFVGARFLVQETAEPREVRSAGTPIEFYPFIYPPTQAERDTTVAEVAQGSMPMWTEPDDAAALFAVNVMGWDPNDVEASVRGDDPVSVVITNPSLNQAAGAPSDLRTAVYLAQVPGSDPPIYAVLAAQAEDMELEPVGPDAEFGQGGRIAFRGRVSFVPKGASVVLSVDRRPRAPVVVEADGTFEVEVDIAAGPSTLLSVALQDRNGRTLALTSSRLATPVPLKGEELGSAQAELPAQLPPPVAETRQAILDAAQAFDWEALRALIPEQGFTFSFGGDTDPVAYWQRLESRAHVPVIGDILPMVLSTEPALRRGVYWWPAPAAEDPARWDEHELEILRQIHVEEDIRLFQEMGLYTGWRVGIDRDGTWVFFVSGD
jgi:hypothetical protein